MLISPSLGGFVLYLKLDEVPVRFLWFSVLWLEPLAFSGRVFFTPPILFSILGFISHSTFWIFQHPGYKVPDVGWLSPSGLPVGYVGFIG